MKSLIASLVLLFAFHAFADDAQLAAVKAADKARIEAVLAGDKDKLNAILSDELRYAHSSGAVDTKQSFIDAVTSGKMKYTAIDYEEQNFTLPAPTIALMNGRVHLKVGAMEASMSFLAVWRNENGQWRFLAWQSCKLPVPAK
jgi:hypothetical protein